jgi:signal transduction histidine kinase
LLEDVVKRYQTEYKISEPVTIENPLGDLEFNTSVEVMEEALSKLLINAWEAYGDDHKGPRPITIQTALNPDHPEGEMVELRIIDHGRGIDPKIRDHMFEPFTSTKHTVGVGMGLTVARHSLRSIGGNVELIDCPDGGVCATVLHPRKAEPAS